MAWLFELVYQESGNAKWLKLCFSLIFGWKSIWLAVMAWLFELVYQELENGNMDEVYVSGLI
jgi:hypothetical protein